MAPEERRAHLLACARKAFSAKGYHRTGVADIVREANVAQGTFYNYFQSKRQIFDELLDGLLAEIQGAVQPVRLGDGHPPPLEQLRANLERGIGTLLAESDLTKILISEAVGLDPEGDEKLLAFYGEMLAIIERAFDWGQRLGLTRPGDPKLQARMVLGTIKEVVYQTVMLGDRREASAIAEAVIEHNLRGILMPGILEQQ